METSTSFLTYKFIKEITFRFFSRKHFLTEKFDIYLFSKPFISCEMCLKSFQRAPLSIRKGSLFYSTHKPRPHSFFYGVVYQNYFITAPSHQNYYFMTLLVDSFSFISVFSKFTFHFNYDKII